MIKWDGHTHTQFCKHGSAEDLLTYVERAIELGFQRYSVTEHPPIPARLVDNPQLMAELAMSEDELPAYFRYARSVKERTADRIEVAVGLELDYLPGQTSYTDRIVDQYGKQLEDTVLSVHYLPGRGGIRCIDFTSDDFKEGLLDYYGNMEKVVEEYYNHVEQLIEWAAPLPMRKRIGHINLIEKFRMALPEIDENQIKKRLQAILPKLRAGNIGVDVNTAGLRVKTCGKPYVPSWFIQECLADGVSCVYGSDAHHPQYVGAAYDWYEAQVLQKMG